MKQIQLARKTTVLFLAVFVLGIFAFGADAKIVVKVNSANVRLKPDLESPVIGKAVMGQTLEALEKTNDWYLVQLPAGSTGGGAKGYIHQSVVDIVAPGGAVSKTREKAAVKPAAKAAAKPARARTVRSASPDRKKIYLRIGGGYASKSFDYDHNWTFPMYGEDAQVSEKYSVDASGVAIEAGLGYMITPSVGVELSFTPASGKSKGTFAATFPHPFYFDNDRAKDWTNNSLKYSASELNLDVLYAFPVSSKFGLYVMAGGTYFMGVKIGSLKVIDWTETAYPYFDLNITPQYGNYTASAFGFNAGGGLDYKLSPSLAVNLNARFSSGTAKVSIEGNKVSVPAGGIRATAGLKIGF
ncbi:MAG: outer membrane beta-barrel protein [Candidatus Aminicenantales bacterium]